MRAEIFKSKDSGQWVQEIVGHKGYEYEWVFKEGNGKWYFRLIADNNEIVAQSQGYKTKQSAKKTLHSIFDSLKKQGRLSITEPLSTDDVEYSLF